MSRSKSKNPPVTADTLRGEVRELAHDTREYARRKVGDLAEAVKDRAGDTLQTVREKGGEVAESTREAVTRGRHAVNDEYERALDFVRARPLAAVSAGIVAGMILGALLRGRRD